MAEQIPYSVAASLINRMTSSAFREVGRICGVMDKLERLKNTIESIKAVLLDAEEKQEQSHAVRDWIRKLKEVLHAADDLLDDFAIEDMRRKADAGGKKKVIEVFPFLAYPNRIVFHHEMAHKIEMIRQSINDVAEEMSRLNLRSRDVIIKQTDSSRREIGSFVLESDIIGREDSKREIISLLRQPHGNQNVSLIAIVGIGGVGKTAFAQLVYNDIEVKTFFEKRMWVCVSDNFDVKTVVKKILESSICSEIDDNLSLDDLQNKLQENIRDKRYLLVLDDIWNESHQKWTQLRTYLMCGAQGSKILVTTHSKIVAQTMGVSTPYVLNGLSTEESWCLLKNIAFGDDTNGMNQTLETIGKKIAEKCGGIPLAIRTVGGLLQWKNKEIEWINVLQSDFWKSCQDEDSIIQQPQQQPFPTMRGRQDEHSIMSALKLSYQNLSPQLRQCFAYCSLYPKDWKIEKEELVQLWMAQGYLQCSTEEQHMEDVGNRFVKIFLTESIFQDAKVTEYGTILSFKMNNSMHDLAMLVAGNDCYLEGEGKGLVGRPMHVSLESHAICLLDSLDTSRLRTLISRSHWVTQELPRSHWVKKELPVISNFKYLRVLRLSSFYLNKLPYSIGKLKHLRYLDLSCCRQLTSLPKSISNLVSLQTLKLNWCEKLVSIKVVTKLINLRHLQISGCKALEDGMPVGLGKLSSLQHLSTFFVGDGRKRKTAKLNEMKDLNNLRGSLAITHLNWVRDVALESQEINLKEKNLLQSLELLWKDDRHCNNNSDSLQLLENLCPPHDLKSLKVSGYPGVKFPNWFSLLSNIVEISLNICRSCQHIPPLERLPSLKNLLLKSLDDLESIYFEEVSPTAVAFFPSLERLEFSRCVKLRGWCRMGDDVNDTRYSHHLSLPPFPRLSELKIKLCPMLTCMPTFTTLVKGLELLYCSVKPLEATLNTAVSMRSVHSSSSFAPLSMLKSLSISKSLDINALPKYWLQNLTSLEHLIIDLSESLALEEFEIWCKDDLNCLPSLQKITIQDCEELKALPDWICNVSSLQHIKILCCRNLASLPEGMPRLTELQTLKIIACPLLLEECRKETGAAWHKIAHIPNIILM